MQPAAITIPRSPDELTAEWLSAALGAMVVDVKRRDIGAGLGNASVVIALDLKFAKHTSRPHQLVAKLRHPLLADKAVAYGYNLRETAFYRDVQPLLPPGLAPQCFYQACDPNGDPYVILLEELRGRSPSLVDGCTTDEAAAFLESLAGLHSALRGASRLNEFTWLTGFDQTFEKMVAMMPVLVGRFVEQMNGRCQTRTLDIMRKIAPRWAAYQAACARRPDAGLAMFDSKIENGIYLPREGGGERVTLIDFALISRSIGTWDVVNCLYSLPVAARRQSEQHLLDHYFGALQTDRGNYSRAQFQRDYEDAILVQLVFVVLVAATPDSNPRITQVRNALVERCLASAEDHDLSAAVARWMAL